MHEKALRHITHSHAAQHTGLICVPTAIAVDPRAVVPELRTVPLEEWLRLPAEAQAPEAAVATCDLQDDDVTILVTDARTLTPVSVLFGPREMLPAFAAAFADRSADGPGRVNWRAVFCGRFNAVINLKGPGSGGGNPGPRYPDPHHLARNIAFAELASMSTIEVASTRGTPGGPHER